MESFGFFSSWTVALFSLKLLCATPEELQGKKKGLASPKLYFDCEHLSRIIVSVNTGDGGREKSIVLFSEKAYVSF